MASAKLDKPFSFEFVGVILHLGYFSVVFIAEVAPNVVDVHLLGFPKTSLLDLSFLLFSIYRRFSLPPQQAV